MAKYLRWIVTLGWCWHLATCDPSVDPHLSEGYYAFEEATAFHRRPPSVRKPPYVKMDVSCPESNEHERFSPRDALCGDLNKGFIPRNPMGQLPLGQPYPFELIRNKTLEFLSQTLPFLKKEVKIPKVARYAKSPQPYRKPGDYFNFHKMPFHYRDRRSLNDTSKNETVNSVDLSVLSNGTSEESEKNSSESSRAHNPCPAGSGLLCTLSNVVSNSRLPLAVLGAVAQSLSNGGSPVTTTTTPKPTVNSNLDTVQSMVQIMFKLLSTLANTNGQNNSVKTSDGGGISSSNNSPSPLSQVIPLLFGESDDNSNVVSLLLKILSDESFLSLFSNGIPSRRRRPTSEEIPVDTPGNYGPADDVRLHDLPPTPCPSLEEYVTPIFARNYQGVWKYVVQIPQEGYFTQTIQQTKCVKNHCDFMDGVCHESPRWVSLLVAELFYPDTYFPTKPPAESSTEVPPVEDFNNFQQYLRRRVGDADVIPTYYSNYYRQYPTSSSNVKKKNSQKQCDGYDSTGCYIVRLYYDWFLVNGSCKCWKPNAKRFFTQK